MTDDRQRETTDADPELDEVLGELDTIERSRKKKTIIVAVAVLACAGAIFWWMAQRTDDLFRPNIDVEEGERELIEDTGDPVCRNIIYEVDRLDDEYRRYEFDFEDEVWGDDEEELERLEQLAADFRVQFDELRDDIDDAVFRDEDISGHPPVPEQVEEWFGNMDNEFRILEEMADRRRRIVQGDEVEPRDGLWENPRQLRDTVLMTLDENFEEFRVWVIRGGHPCGPPPEGVEPWEPEDPEQLEGVAPD